MPGDHLLRVRDLVGSAHSAVFPFELFNSMQSIIAEQAYSSDANMVVAAPTGCGKTAVFELAILRAVSREDTLRCLYIAPNKALCNQRAVDWSKAFASLNLLVVELTGDSRLEHSLQLVAKANIVVTTPEKWDSMTRVWKKHVFLLGSVNLLLIDEVHHVSEDRGAVLEAVVVRVQTLRDSFCRGRGIESRLRMVALSATLPNIDDIGVWLRCNSDAIHYFDDTFRPVPLEMHTLSFGPSAWNPFLYERSLDSKVLDVLRRYSDGKPSLVFCGSKKNVETLAESLSLKMRVPVNFTSDELGAIGRLQDSKLRALARLGFGFHHAGLPPEDKETVEELYLHRKLLVLTCTSTLAYGVNLPAHLVVIKGTNQYRGGEGYVRMGRSTVLQMVGRAGRQGMDSLGVACVMTSDEDKEFYASSAMDVVDSALASRLNETLCAEISQSVITDLLDALSWLKRTLFYVRARRDKLLYGYGSAQDETQLDAMLKATCTTAIEQLAAAGIVEYDADVASVSPNVEAHLMSKHLIKFSTMSAMMKLDPTTDLLQLLNKLCMVDEVKKPVRRMEKKVLNELMKSARFPLKLRVQEPHHKAYVLLLSAVSFSAAIADFTLRVEQSDIVQHVLRILLMLRELCIATHKGALLESCIRLRRALETRVWDTESSVLSECPGLAEPTKKTLAATGPKSVEELRACSAQSLQMHSHCSSSDALVLARFAKSVCAKVLSASMVVTASELVFKVHPAVACDAALGLVDAPHDLVAYDLTSGLLLCSRQVHLCATTQELRFPLHDLSFTQIRAAFLGPYSILDVDLTPRPAAAPAPREEETPLPSVRVALSKPKHKADKDKDKATKKETRRLAGTGEESKISSDFGVYAYEAPATSVPASQRQADVELASLKRIAAQAGPTSVSVKRLAVRPGLEERDSAADASSHWVGAANDCYPTHSASEPEPAYEPEQPPPASFFSRRPQSFFTAFSQPLASIDAKLPQPVVQRAVEPVVLTQPVALADKKAEARFFRGDVSASQKFLNAFF